MTWIGRLLVTSTLFMLAHSAYICRRYNSLTDARTVYLNVHSATCDSPISDVGITQHCYGFGVRKTPINYEEISPGLYKFTAPEKRHILRISKQGFKVAKVTIVQSTTLTTATISLQCQSGTSVCEGAVASQLTVNNVCEATQGTEPVVMWTNGVTSQAQGGGVYLFGACPLCSVPIHIATDNGVASLALYAGDTTVAVGCAGCLVLDVLLTSSYSGSSITGASMSLPYTEIELGTYRVQICDAGLTELTITHDKYDGTVVAIPEVLPEQMHVELFEDVRSHAGTAFMFGYMTQHYANHAYPYIYITAREPTDVRIRVPGIGMDYTEAVNGSVSIQLPTAVAMYHGSTVEHKGVELTSDLPISVYTLNEDYKNIDGSVILPVSMLGTEYIIHTYDDYTSYNVEAMVVAVEDDTDVTFINQQLGTTESFTLNKFDAVQINEAPMSGVLITATKPIEVQMGHERAYVINSGGADYDYLSTSIPPISALGRVFIVPQMASRPGYAVGIAAPYDNTDIIIYDEDENVLQTLTLQAQDSELIFYEDQSIVIEATEGILVAQYGVGYNNYDPALTFIPAPSQYTSWYQFYTADFFYDSDTTLCVVIDSTEVDGLRLNDAAVSPYNSTLVSMAGGGSYSIEYVKITNDVLYLLTHVNADLKFGAFMYAGIERLEYATVLGYELPSQA